MKKVTILGLYNSMATTIFGPMDILNQAGRLWNRLAGTEHTPFFDVTIASPDGTPIRSVNRIRIQPHCSIEEIDQSDLIIIASATYIDKILEQNPELPDWIRYHYHKGAHVASICTGAFLLAETGLLDGKSATLHWGFADLFKARYPDVALRHDRMFIDHGRLYCSAGVSAGMDLSYIQQLRVEKAKRMLEEGNRTFNEITYAVGYEDISFFRKVFVRLTGLRPKEYQQKFSGYGYGENSEFGGQRT